MEDQFMAAKQWLMDWLMPALAWIVVLGILASLIAAALGVAR
jgi:hypothetical protein